jgi:hypothetical protein
MLGNKMLEKACGSQLAQVTVSRGSAREAGEARTGAKWMGLEPELNQTSLRQCFDTCFDADDVEHTSPVKRGCDHTCTEALHTKCHAARQYVGNARGAPRFWDSNLLITI